MTERIAAESTARLSGHQRRATELIESVCKTASELFEIPYHAPEGGQGYEMVRKPSWVSYTWENSFSPVSGEFIEKILPGGMRERRARNRLKGQISQLVTQNFENLRWQTLQNIESSFQKFSSDLDTRLAETINATHDAIRTARNLRSEQSVPNIGYHHPPSGKNHGDSGKYRATQVRATGSWRRSTIGDPPW